MILNLIFLVICISIVHLQLNISDSFYSHFIKANLSSKYMTLSDYYFNFKEAPTLRNLNLKEKIDSNQHKSKPKKINKIIDTFNFSLSQSKNNKHEPKATKNYKDASMKISKFKRNLGTNHQPLDIKYKEIQQFDIFRDWIDKVLLPYIYEDDNGILINQNYIIGDPKMFLGMRFVNATVNLDNSSNKAIYYTIPAKEYTIFDKMGDEIGTKPREMYYSEGVYNFINQGNFTTFYGAGGYIFPYPRDKDIAYSLYYLYESDITEVFWVNLYYTFLAFNRNNKNMILNVVEIDCYPSGEYVPKFHYYTIKQFYSTPLDFFRMALEFLFIILYSWFSYLLFKKFLFYIYYQFANTIQSKDKKLDNSANKSFINSFRAKIYSSNNCCNAFLIFLWMTVYALVKLIFAVIKFTFKNINNFIDTFSFIINLILISQWIYIATENLFEIDENGKADGSMEYAYILQKYIEDYILICTIVIILLFIKLLKFLKLSYKFSIFFETIKASGNDIAFFSVSLILIIFGYSMIGNLLFGIYQFKFKYVHYSFISIFELICGGYYLEDIISYNKIVLYIYGISFTFTVILLLNMMIAILFSHYFEYHANLENLDANFIKLLLRNFIRKDSNQNQNEKIGTIKKTLEGIVRMIRNWTWSIKESKFEFKEIARYKNNDKKYYSNQIKLNLNQKIRDFIEESDGENGEFLERNASKNRVKLTFWVSLIDNILSRSICKGYLFSLCNPKYNMLDQKFKVFENQESEDSEENIDNDIITFVILPLKNKICMWSKASAEKKMLYWNSLLNNSKSENPLFVNLSLDDSVNYSIEQSLSCRDKNCSIYYNDEELISEEHKESNTLINNYYRGGTLINQFNKQSHELIVKTKDTNSHDYSHFWIKHTDKDSMFILWFELFLPKHRAFLWNSINFPFHYFEEVSSSVISSQNLKDYIKNYSAKGMQRKFNGYQALESLTNRELFELAFIISKNFVDSEKLLTDKPNCKRQHIQFMKINHLMNDFNDFKSCLWIPLTFKQKFELYLKSTRKRERELISLLFIFDARQNNQKYELLFNKEINNILKFDKYVEGTLTTLIYEKYIQACENQTTKAKIEKLVKHMKEQSTYLSDHMSFVRFFHETYFKSVMLINDLKFESILALQNMLTKNRKSSEYDFE